jgi:hypothetical protein
MGRKRSYPARIVRDLHARSRLELFGSGAGGCDSVANRKPLGTSWPPTQTAHCTVCTVTIKVRCVAAGGGNPSRVCDSEVENIGGVHAAALINGKGASS